MYMPTTSFLVSKLNRISFHTSLTDSASSAPKLKSKPSPQVGVPALEFNSEGIPLFPHLDLMTVSALDIAKTIDAYLTALYRK